MASDFYSDEYTELLAEINKCPKRLQSMLMNLLMRNDDLSNVAKELIKEGIVKCDSPIEMIFKVAFDVVCRSSFDNSYHLESQHKIETKGNTYYADFLVWHDDENIKVIIEIDGHDFHEKTKEQVAHDKEREYQLKMEGYEILRFSGSQIFNSPCVYANKALEFLDLQNWGW